MLKAIASSLAAVFALVAALVASESNTSGPTASSIKQQADEILESTMADMPSIAHLLFILGIQLTAYVAVTLAAIIASLTTLLLVATIGLFGSSSQKAAATTWQYWRALLFYTFDGAYNACPTFKDDLRRRAYVYSLSLILYLWNKPHYRSGTFQQDTIKNLRNVALPGTGVPLSYFAAHKIIMAALLFFGMPVVALVFAIILTPKRTLSNMAVKYEQLLVEPEEWFFYWRLNCRLASYHALLTDAKGYVMEDKWSFLLEAEKLEVPVSPFLKMDGLVVKDRNEEGGMGIHFFKNATEGGAWIIQPALHNKHTLASWLPDKAPLSTMRVITASDGALDVVHGSIPETEADRLEQVKVLSCVFRAGRQGASTDHSSILYDVDQHTGKMTHGTTNAHWYRLGLHGDLLQYKPAPNYTEHPDSKVNLIGKSFKDMTGIKQLVRSAHAKMLPDVPLAGWDVAITREHGICLLEANLSCNFFNGSFDRTAYFTWVDSLLAKLDEKRRAQ
eukprot:TRINITY_DN5725_c0_g1_i2.p1 TRINITY_DN5725_c0_g1~~TRINITY_DN5725_c0_g1_i2.p1  ORF type:complete len:504 (+),score=113.04 TRINITY_DN5725_c0_g1_i2:255-1766(+)